MKNLKRLSFLVILMVMMAAVSKTAFARPYFPTKCNLYKFSNVHSYYWVMDDVKSKGDITKLKNSSKSIAEVSVKTVDDSVVIDIVPKKAGKTKVSFTAKSDDTTYKYKCSFTVKTNVNPFKSLKVGKTVFTKKFGKTNYCNQKIGKTLKGQQVKVSIKKGWKLQSITAWTSDDLEDPYKKIKNGNKVTLYTDSILQFELFDPDGTQVIYYIYYKK